MKHLEKGWYGANKPLVGPVIETACGKNLPIEEITRKWSEVDCNECGEHLERLADESVKEP